MSLLSVGGCACAPVPSRSQRVIVRFPFTFHMFVTFVVVCGFTSYFVPIRPLRVYHKQRLGCPSVFQVRQGTLQVCVHV